MANAIIKNRRKLNKQSKLHILKIKMLAGLMDFSITGADNLMWYFPDGTTSTATRPAKTLTTAGTVYALCDDWSKNTIVLNSNTTNANYVGTTDDLSALTNYVTVTYTAMSGDVANMKALYTSNCSYSPNLYGNVGGIAALSNAAYMNCPNLYGDVAGIKATNNVYFQNTKVSGDIKDIKARAQLYFEGTDIDGSLSEFHWVYISLVINNTKVYGAYTNVSGNLVPTTTNFSNTLMTASDMDNTLIAYANCTKTNGTFIANGMTRTSASDSAITTLVGKGWTITGITKV